MSGAIPPLPQYALVAGCLVKQAQVQLYLPIQTTRVYAFSLLINYVHKYETKRHLR
jgi:hypothetical protein